MLSILIDAPTGDFEMEVIIQESPDSAARVAASIIARLIREKPTAVLGLATGGTMEPVYRELVRLHRNEGLDFSRAATFNLDEYIGLSVEHPSSYHAFMQEHFFRYVNVAPDRIHIPNGNAADVPRACREYEDRIRALGGIDLQLLGIGRDGHIGFNEPSSSLASRTRIKTLTQETLLDNARFFGEAESVPRHVVTMGIGTIMDSGQCVLLAFGASKAEAVAGTVEGPVSASLPASVLQFHENVQVIIDRPASGKLERTEYYDWVYEGKPDWQRYE